MKDHSAGGISDAEAQRLIADLSKALDLAGFEFHYGVSYRNLLVYRGSEDFQLTTKPPHEMPEEPVSRYLPRGKSKRGRRGKRGGSPASFIEGRVSLANRPLEAADRSVPGHWEADLMMFSKYGQAVLTVHERTSRLLLGIRLASKVARGVARHLVRFFSYLPQELRQTVTFDNGTEFASHLALHSLSIETFFCDPHAPWQKGGIENAIGRMRRFIPRKTDLAALSTTRFRQTIAAYNNTPRKCLDYRTPAESFAAQVLHFECESTSWLSPGRRKC